MEIKFDIGSILKFFENGNIAKAYEKMYALADRIASHETDNYNNELKSKVEVAGLTGRRFDNQFLLESISTLFKFRNERLRYHMNEMIKLLEMRNKNK